MLVSQGLIMKKLARLYSTCVAHSEIPTVFKKCWAFKRQCAYLCPGPGNADGQRSNPIHQGHGDGDQHQMDLGRLERFWLLRSQNIAAWAMQEFLDQTVSTGDGDQRQMELGRLEGFWLLRSQNVAAWAMQEFLDQTVSTQLTFCKAMSLSLLNICSGTVMWITLGTGHHVSAGISSGPC